MLNRFQIADIVRKLDALQDDDPEGNHREADHIIAEALPDEIKDAVKRLKKRSGGWWFA